MIGAELIFTKTPPKSLLNKGYKKGSILRVLDELTQYIDGNLSDFYLITPPDNCSDEFICISAPLFINLLSEHFLKESTQLTDNVFKMGDKVSPIEDDILSLEVENDRLEKIGRILIPKSAIGIVYDVIDNGELLYVNWEKAFTHVRLYCGGVKHNSCDLVLAKCNKSPISNNGYSTCQFGCNCPTKEVELWSSIINVCPKCGK